MRRSSHLSHSQRRQIIVANVISRTALLWPGVGAIDVRSTSRLVNRVNRSDQLKWVPCRLFTHVTGFELFTGSARAGVVATDLFCKVAEGFALLFGRLLAAGDGSVLLVPDAPWPAPGKLRLGLLVNGLARSSFHWSQGS